MSEEIIIPVYLCSGTRVGLEVLDNNEPSSDNNEPGINVIVIKLVPEWMNNPTIMITVSLVSTNWELNQADEMAPELSYSNVDYFLDSGTYRYIQTDWGDGYYWGLTKVDLTMPDACDFSKVTVTGSLSGDLISWNKPVVNDGLISDGNAIDTWDIELYTDPIPGEVLWATYEFYFSNAMTTSAVGYSAPGLTFGIVKQVGWYVAGVTKIYLVESEGESGWVHNTQGTDVFVNDIVFVSKGVFSEWEPESDSLSYGDMVLYNILPINIKGFGLPGFNMVCAKYNNTKLFIGLITAITGTTVSVFVYGFDVIVNNVEVYCRGNTMFKDMDCFYEGQTVDVLVMGSIANIAVIGPYSTFVLAFGGNGFLGIYNTRSMNLLGTEIGVIKKIISILSKAGLTFYIGTLYSHYKTYLLNLSTEATLNNNTDLAHAADSILQQLLDAARLYWYSEVLYGGMKYWLSGETSNIESTIDLTTDTQYSQSPSFSGILTYQKFNGDIVLIRKTGSNIVVESDVPVNSTGTGLKLFFLSTIPYEFEISGMKTYVHSTSVEGYGTISGGYTETQNDFGGIHLQAKNNALWVDGILYPSNAVVPPEANYSYTETIGATSRNEYGYVGYINPNLEWYGASEGSVKRYVKKYGALEGPHPSSVYNNEWFYYEQDWIICGVEYYDRNGVLTMQAGEITSILDTEVYTQDDGQFGSVLWGAYYLNYSGVIVNILVGQIVGGFYCYRSTANDPPNFSVTTYTQYEYASVVRDTNYVSAVGIVPVTSNLIFSYEISTSVCAVYSTEGQINIGDTTFIKMIKSYMPSGNVFLIDR